jgi:protein involved in polysaccharide export with SLBB domain
VFRRFLTFGFERRRTRRRLPVVLVALLLVGGGSVARAQTEAAAGAVLAAGDRVSVTISSAPGAVYSRQPIRAGDQLGLVYHIATPAAGQPYRLEAGDKLSLQFTYGSEIRPIYVSPGEKEDYYLSPINRLYTIQPDGTLRLVGLRGPVRAAGRTLDELTSRVERLYLDQQVLQIPDVTIGVEQRPDLRHASIRELLRGERDEPASFLSVPVPGDGFVSLPLIGSVLVAGRGVDEVGESVTRLYRERGYDRLTVTIFFERIGANATTKPEDAAPNGSKTVEAEVTAAGTIELPLVGGVAVAGKTVEAAGETVAKEYRLRGLEKAEVKVERRTEAP